MCDVTKAHVVLSDGTKVTIDGTPDEVASLLHKISSPPGQPDAGRNQASTRRRRRSAAKGSAKTKTTKSKRKGPTDYIRELMAENFFKTKRGLGEVKDKLEERAHIYPVTNLSPSLFRLVKAKELRRVNEN